MSFRTSRCVGIAAKDPAEASRFYQEVVGMKLVGLSEGIELDAGGLTVFVDPGPPRPPILELETTDLHEAKKDLRRFGFEELSWNTPDAPNLVVDPHGVRWNIIEKQEPALLPVKPHVASPVQAKIGLQTPFPERTAHFYAQLLDCPPTPSLDGWIIDDILVRILLQDRLPVGPVFYLEPGFDISKIDETAVGEDPLALDPFGVRWKLGPAQFSENAVVQTKLPL